MYFHIAIAFHVFNFLIKQNAHPIFNTFVIIVIISCFKFLIKQNAHPSL